MSELLLRRRCEHARRVRAGLHERLAMRPRGRVHDVSAEKRLRAALHGRHALSRRDRRSAAVRAVGAAIVPAVHWPLPAVTSTTVSVERTSASILVVEDDAAMRDLLVE